MLSRHLFYAFLSGFNEIPDVIPTFVLHQARREAAVQCVGGEQDSQDVQHPVCALVFGRLRPETAHAQLCAEL